MEADSWTGFSVSSRRHRATLQSRLEMLLGLEEMMDSAEDEPRIEFTCPFCADDFDLVGLCFHIDEEHPVEVKRGLSVCPLCAARVGMDLIGHITIEHEDFFKAHHKRRVSKGSLGTNSTLALLNKDLREGKHQYLFGGSPHTHTPNASADPLLSSFIVNVPMAEPPKDVELDPLESSVSEKIANVEVVESSESSLSEKDQEERTRRSEFAQGLVLSTIFEDIL